MKAHYNEGRGSTPCGLLDPSGKRHLMYSRAGFIVRMATSNIGHVCSRCLAAARKAADLKTPAPRQETPGPQSKE